MTNKVLGTGFETELGVDFLHRDLVDIEAWVWSAKDSTVVGYGWHSSVIA